jgi:hypothetical protein
VIDVSDQEYMYAEYFINLTPDALGNRRKSIDTRGNRLYIDVTRTDADLSRLYIGVDDKGVIPASLTRVIDVYPDMFSKINIEWTSENDGKTLVLVVTRYSAKIAPPQPVEVINTVNANVAGTVNARITGTVNAKITGTDVMVPVDLQARYKPPGFVLFSGTVTTNGNTADIDVSNFSAMEIALRVTSVSGTSPSLSVFIEGRFEATGDYRVLASQTGITSTGVWFFTINPLIFRYIRVRWAVSGTNPSFAIQVVAQAMV